MRTRSQASAKNSIAGKRKKGHDCAAHENGAGSKRRMVKTLREAPNQETARRSSTGTEGFFSPSTKKSISRKRKKSGKSPAQDDGASNKQRRVQTHEDPDQEMTCRTSAGTEMAEVPCSTSLTCREGGDEINSGSLAGGRTSPNTVFTNKSRFQGHILALPATNVKPSAAASKKQSKKDSVHTASEDVAEDNCIEQCSSVFERNCIGVQSHQEHLHEQNITSREDTIQHSEDCHEIAGTAILPDTLCQKGNQNDQNGHCKDKGTLSGIDSFHVDKSQPGSCTDSMKRKHVHLRSHSAQKNKQLKNIRRAHSVPMLMKSTKPNLKGIRAAKLRWKHLIQSIINAKSSPGSASADDKLQGPQSGGEHRQDTLQGPQSLRKKRKRSVGHDGSPAARQRPTVHRQQQKIGKQLRSLLRWIKTWLIQAKFSQAISTNTQNSGEAFIMTEDERNSFAQTMVRSCQQNKKLRTLFLESVRTLTMSGLMHAAASTLLQEETCEQAQTLMDAWAEFKEQNTVTRPLPMNLLKAVNQLHEMRGDVSTKFNTSEDSFGLKKLDEKTWKLMLPTLPEPEPVGTKNIPV